MAAPARRRLRHRPRADETGETAERDFFCIPRLALEALLDAKATAYEICTYLALARHVEECGRHAYATVGSVNRWIGASRVGGGPVEGAIARLKTICAAGHGPILFDREGWQMHGSASSSGFECQPMEPLFVLPAFDEAPDAPLRFGIELVDGSSDFARPLRALKDCGGVAARLLIAMHAADDAAVWGGVRPVGRDAGPWRRYQPLDKGVALRGGGRLIRARPEFDIATIDERISDGDAHAYFEALRVLCSVGLVLEKVLVLNRGAVRTPLDGGDEYDAIAHDAEPLYELERSLAAAGNSRATWAAIGPDGRAAMIAGIYRLRFGAAAQPELRAPLAS